MGRSHLTLDGVRADYVRNIHTDHIKEQVFSKLLKVKENNDLVKIEVSANKSGVDMGLLHDAIKHNDIKAVVMNRKMRNTMMMYRIPSRCQRELWYNLVKNTMTTENITKLRSKLPANLFALSLLRYEHITPFDETLKQSSRSAFYSEMVCDGQRMFLKHQLPKKSADDIFIDNLNGYFINQYCGIYKDSFTQYIDSHIVNIEVKQSICRDGSVTDTYVSNLDACLGEKTSNTMLFPTCIQASVKGSSLRDVVRSRATPYKGLFHLFKSIQKLGVDVGFVHNDAHDDNVIVRPNGSCVLLDFGRARFLQLEKNNPKLMQDRLNFECIKCRASKVHFKAFDKIRYNVEFNDTMNRSVESRKFAYLYDILAITMCVLKSKLGVSHACYIYGHRVTKVVPNNKKDGFVMKITEPENLLRTLKMRMKHGYDAELVLLPGLMLYVDFVKHVLKDGYDKASGVIEVSSDQVIDYMYICFQINKAPLSDSKWHARLPLDMFKTIQEFFNSEYRGTFTGGYETHAHTIPRCPSSYWADRSKQYDACMFVVKDARVPLSEKLERVQLFVNSAERGEGVDKEFQRIIELGGQKRV